MKVLPSEHLKLVYSVLVVFFWFCFSFLFKWLHCFLPKGLQKQAFIRSFFQLKAKYTYGNLPKPLFFHATTTGIEQARPKRKQSRLEATEHSFLFIVREVIVSISLKQLLFYSRVFRYPCSWLPHGKLKG